RLFVPDYGAGQVWVVDPDGARVLARPRVLPPKTRFQLLTRDGVVFFNDPGSARACVIRLDGGVPVVTKHSVYPIRPSPLDHTPPAPPATPTPTNQRPDTPKAPPPPAAKPPTSTPPPATPPGPSPKPAPTVRIALSTATPLVDENVVVQAVAGTGGGPAPTSAQ